MKATLLFLFLPVVCFGQIIDINKIDEFTDTKTISTRLWTKDYPTKHDFIDINKSLSLALMYNKSESGIEFYQVIFSLIGVKDIGCLTNYDGKAILLFENGSKITVKQASDIECKSGYYLPTYVLSEDKPETQQDLDLMSENFNYILNNNLDKVRIYGTKGYIDFELKEDKKDFLSKHANLIEKAKSN